MFADFCQIEIKGEDTGKYVCEVVLNSEHAVYKGHFPGMPVTPGVCMLRIVKDCASRIKNVGLRYERITGCKFMAVVDPNQTDRLLINLEFGDNGSLRATASADGKTVLKLKARLIEAQ